MDTTDPAIQFDVNGVCNHCTAYQNTAASGLRNDEAGQRELQGIIRDMKSAGKGRAYDCIIGVSGGVDSTYAAYLAKEKGLRPLAVHMDNGWDSELAVANIEHVLKKLEIDLITCVLDWEEFKDLQLSFLKASVPDAEIPTDHAIGGVIYKLAREKKISYILTGINIATEGILPGMWTYGVGDWTYIKNVHARFGEKKLCSFPHFSHVGTKYYQYVKGLNIVPILDYVPYNKQESMHVLENELGWKYYGGKHYESIYTRFFQGYILPRKFNIDKRKAHLSTLICSGQISREEALKELEKSPYDESMMREDKEYVLKKLCLSEEQFESLMSLPVKSYKDYRTILNSPFYLFLRKIKRYFKKLIGLRFKLHTQTAGADGQPAAGSRR